MPATPQGDQSIGQSLGSRDATVQHLPLPPRAPQVGIGNTQPGTNSRVERIHDGLGVDLVGAERQGLHGPAQRARFTDSRYEGKGCVERLDPGPVEPSTMATCAVAGGGSPCLLRIVRTINGPDETSHHASGVAAGHDAVQIGMHVVRPTLAHQLIGCHAAEAR